MRRDIERFVRNQLGVYTDAERDRQFEQALRYSDEPEPDIWDYPLGLQKPPGFLAANTTTQTAFVSGTTYARYLGRACRGLNQIDVLIEVMQASVGTITWSEFAIGFSGDPPFTAGASTIDLQLLQYLGTGGPTASGGRKLIQIIDLPQSIQGTHLWLLCGGQAATTQFQIRAGLPDVVQAGYLYAAAATRPSTMSGYVTFTTVATSFADIWVDFKQRSV